MRKKNYLSPEAQWDRSVALAVRYGFIDQRFRDHGLRLGRIVLPHKYFLRGDFVLVPFTNGMAERQEVWGVSSKGYEIRGHYLNHGKFSDDHPLQGKMYSIRVSNRLAKPFAVYTRVIKRKCRRPLKWGAFAQGPLRWIEVPDHLLDYQADDPHIRQYIVALAREGLRMPGKRE